MAETILINEEQPTLTINEVKSGANENEILVDVSLDQASDLSVSTSFLLMINGESEESSEKIEGKISFDKGETTKTIVIKLPSTSLSLEDISISVHSPENTNLTSKGTIIKSEISSTTNETISRASPLKSGEVSKVYFFNLQDTSQNAFKPTESIVDTVINLPLSGKEKRAARRLQKTLNEGGIDSQDSQGNLIKIQQVDLKINEAPANLGDSQSSEVVANPKRAARRLARALRRAEKASRNEISETNNDSNQNNNQGKVDLTSLLVSREAKEVLPSTDFQTSGREGKVSTFGMSQMMSQMDVRVVEKTVTVTPVTPVKASKTKAVKHFKPKISIDDVTSTDETGSQVFTVTLNKVTTGTVFVDYKTVDITALENEDYTPVTGTLTFAPGSVTQTITVPIIEDTLDEMSENLKVVLSNPLGGKIKDGTGLMTITDDDGISVSPSNVTVTEEASNSTITMTMVLGQPSENVVTVDWETADRESGDATNAYAGLDYTAASGTVTFSAGETSQTFTIPLLADVLSETTEKFNIDLSNPTGGAIIDVPRATVTIVDNDNPPSLTINNVTQAEDAGNATFTVTLSAVSGQDTKVVYNVPSGTATSGDDFTATSGILTILAGNLTGTISVPVLSDNLNEVDETATVTLSSPEGATI
ncbi:hypothetical protein N8782_03360, partial [Methylophilaceae bacterium]|nr:hypothetical protein [Methylophilaceae bacterium]